MDMNRRSKYWNSSADEAIGAYRKKLGLTQIALILMILSIIALAWGRIFTDAVGADLYWASILAILFCAFGIRLYKQILLGRLLAILYTDCDPVKFALWLGFSNPWTAKARAGSPWASIFARDSITPATSGVWRRFSPPSP